MHLASFDYFSDREDPKIGLSRTASLIREARKTAESDGVLFCFWTMAMPCRVPRWESGLLRTRATGTLW